LVVEGCQRCGGRGVAQPLKSVCSHQNAPPSHAVANAAPQ
jgi:hypothetical protein